MNIDDLKKRLKGKEIIILSGGMGSEISARGVKTKLPLWSASALITNPEVVKQIHLDYIESGAEIIVTNTFRTQRRTFEKVGQGSKAKDFTILACKLAQEARKESGKDVLIAGDVTTLEDCYRPDLVPGKKELDEEHLEHIQNLKEGGVDFLLIETINTLKEAEVACSAAVEAGLSFAITFCGDKKGELLSGEKLVDAVKVVEKYKPLYIGLNCMQADAISNNIKDLRETTDLPLAVAAQGDGIPGGDEGWEFNGKNQEELYLKHAFFWIENGVQLIGGCCGTNPSYISKLTSQLNKL